MKLKEPFGLIKQSYIQLKNENIFSVDFKNMTKDYFVIIDVYPVKSPQHPKRHPGWFKFDITSDFLAGFSITYENNKVSINSLNDIATIDKWICEELDTDEIFPLSIRIVIRKKLNNEIVFEDRIICYFSEEGFLEHENYFKKQKSLVENILPANMIIPKNLNVNIILKSFVDNDAIGYFSWEIYLLLRKNGINANLYIQTCDDKFRPFVHNVKELLADDGLSENTILFYNYSIQDEHLVDLIGLPCKKIAYFHGITNPQQLRIFDAELAEECKAGLAQLHRIKDFDLIMVNSKTTQDLLINNLNKHELDELREKNKKNKKSKLRTTVYSSKKPRIKFYKSLNNTELRKKIYIVPPVVISKKTWEQVALEEQFKLNLQSLGDIVLYVGRMYPHKKVDEVLEVFKRYLKINANATLVLVGGSHNSYQKFLQYKINQFAELEKERIVFLEQISREQLKTTYESAKVFITMSEDEGFCIPILEAMNFGLPVLARDGTAASELLDGSGKLICNKDFESIAGEIDRLIKDQDYRQNIIELQNKRLKNYSDFKLATHFLNALLRCYYNHENLN